ncbi:hypothetical protein [Rhodococcus koreensis]
MPIVAEIDLTLELGAATAFVSGLLLLRFTLCVAGVRADFVQVCDGPTAKTRPGHGHSCSLRPPSSSTVTDNHVRWHAGRGAGACRDCDQILQDSTPLPGCGSLNLTE